MVLIAPFLRFFVFYMRRIFLYKAGNSAEIRISLVSARPRVPPGYRACQGTPRALDKPPGPTPRTATARSQIPTPRPYRSQMDKRGERPLVHWWTRPLLRSCLFLCLICAFFLFSFTCCVDGPGKRGERPLVHFTRREGRNLLSGPCLFPLHYSTKLIDLDMF